MCNLGNMLYYTGTQPECISLSCMVDTCASHALEVFCIPAWYNYCDSSGHDFPCIEASEEEMPFTVGIPLELHSTECMVICMDREHTKTRQHARAKI